MPTDKGELREMQLANGGMFWLWEDCCRPCLSHITRMLYKCYFISGHYVFLSWILFCLLPELDHIISRCSDKPLMGFERSCRASERAPGCALFFVAPSLLMSRRRWSLKMDIWWKPNGTLTATSCLCCCGNPRENSETAEWSGFCGNCWLLLFLSLELI